MGHNKNYHNKLTVTCKFLTIVFPENVTITTPAIPKVETTTKTVESNEKLKETPSDDSTGSKTNKRACIIKNNT